ncbi:Sodium-dependent dopamine transporter [Orchesella cincta]|uniref:Transporter n=1 Tax=Orchesella cincta TaxID=48709 RepID=A0A1D2NIU2_ORCCI|nr:Sodium-dependent dopamine transporter [Orchesella cincta]
MRSSVDSALVKVSRIGNPKRHVIAETMMMGNVDDPGGGDSTGGSRSHGKRPSAGGSGLDLNLSTSTLRPIEDGLDDEDGDRETWSQGLDFLLSIIGFAVDLANVWRFPYFCYKNGGGAFLVPYLIFMALSAVPVFYMELLLGQFIRQGPISMWKICPLFKGVGYCAVTVSYFVSFYYNTIMGWSLHFTISSLSSPLPWTSCNNSWNTKQCFSPEVMSEEELMFMRDVDNSSASAYSFDSEELSIKTESQWNGWNNLSTENFLPGEDRSQLAPQFGLGGARLRKGGIIRPPNATSPASEYFRNCVLEMEGHDIDNLGSPKVDLLVCLAFIYCLLYVILFRGIRSTGKVVYVTALLPYLVMLILLIRGVMLEGAVDGIYYYLVPNMTKLWEIGVWSDAAKQIFFSSGAGFGVHLTYASYNNFHNNCYRDCIVTSCVNCFTSIFSGFVIFTFLGSMAHRQGRPIEEVVNVGPGLVFEVYPEAVGTLPGANFWSILFFIMLIMLGIDSAMGGLECVITGITDEFKTFFKKKKHGRECFMFFCVLISFLIGMINVTRGGMYTFQFLDTYAAGSSLLLSVLFEILAVSWVYGLDQLCKDAEAMLGFAPGLYWRICWKFVSPALIAIIIVLDLCTAEELTHEGYRYPDWAQIFGYIFTFIPITLVPIVGFIEFMSFPGDAMTVSSKLMKLSYAITPVSEHAAIKAGQRNKRFQAPHWSYFR